MQGEIYMKIIILGARGLTDDEEEVRKQHLRLFTAVETATDLDNEITLYTKAHEDVALWLNHAISADYVTRTLIYAQNAGVDPVIIYSDLGKEAKKEMLRICTEEGWEFLTFDNFCNKYLTEGT